MSEQDWPVGTVATATVQGLEGVRVLRGSDAAWLSERRLNDAIWHPDPYVTDVRPLVVLDHEFPRTMVKHLRMAAENDSALTTLEWLADQIEAQVRPPRIPEPGLWGVVKANITGRTERGRFVRDGETTTHYWEAVDWNGTYMWSDLIDPAELRPGIEEGS